nr:unnamed protein product [Callosobruchus chinensis]
MATIECCTYSKENDDVWILFIDILNLPYCFIFYWDGTTLATTAFFDSSLLFLCTGNYPDIRNGFLIASLRRAKESQIRSGNGRRTTPT